MKKKYLLIVLNLVICNFIVAQQGNTLNFEYDEAGNQVVRELICVGTGCEPKVKLNSLTGSQPTEDKNNITTDWNVLKENPELKYYPNPVKEDLYINWEDIQEDKVIEIWVYSSAGQFLRKQYTDKDSVIAIVNFSNYSNGMYNVILLFERKQKQVLRIIKK